MPVHMRVRTHSQNCPACGNHLLETMGGLTGGVEIGSPLVVCSRCGKTSYTRMRREWYNYPNKDLLGLIPLMMAMGIGMLAYYRDDPLCILTGAALLAVSVGCGIVEAVRIAKSKRRMRDPEYLAKLLRWQIIRQEEYEDFLRKAGK